MPVEIAGRYEQFSVDGDNTINRFGGIVSIGLFSEATSLMIEFLHTEDSGNTENSVVSQLAVEFYRIFAKETDFWRPDFSQGNPG